MDMGLGPFEDGGEGGGFRAKRFSGTRTKAQSIFRRGTVLGSLDNEPCLTACSPPHTHTLCLSPHAFVAFVIRVFFPSPWPLRVQNNYNDLYWTTGDGGPPEDPNNHAQDLNNLLGAMIRISVPSFDTTTKYLIPSGNYQGKAVGTRPDTRRRHGAVVLRLLVQEGAYCCYSFSALVSMLLLEGSYRRRDRGAERKVLRGRALKRLHFFSCSWEQRTPRPPLHSFRAPPAPNASHTKYTNTQRKATCGCR